MKPQGMRERLEARRLALDELRRTNRLGEGLLLAEREPDPLDAGAERTAARVLAALAETEDAELRRVEAALARIEAGTYGICVDCGNEIELARLEALPEAIRCVECEAAARPTVH